MLLKSAFIGFLSLSTLYADTLKECKNEADRISGCVEKIYHSNGRLWMEKPYKNGKKEGVERLYHGDMSIFVEMPFKNDKPEGIRRWYYENGNIGGEAIYKNGKQDGVIKMYDEGGKLASRSISFKFYIAWRYETLHRR